jgi:aminoglycoside 6'-N-acetyltransferase
MNPPDPHFGFRPVQRSDDAMLLGWLAQPHVRAAWGDPDRELALIHAEIDEGDCKMHVVIMDERPIGFIQDWCPHLAGVPHFQDVPPGTRAVDMFLGDAALRGQGVAAAFVRAYANGLERAGATAVVTDPRLTNPPGIAMYRRAGFMPCAIRIAEDGAPVRCMTFAPDGVLATPAHASSVRKYPRGVRGADSPPASAKGAQT